MSRIGLVLANVWQCSVNIRTKYSNYYNTLLLQMLVLKKQN